MREALSILINIFLLLNCKSPKKSICYLEYSFKVKVVWHVLKGMREGSVLSVKRIHRCLVISRDCVLVIFNYWLVCPRHSKLGILSLKLESCCLDLVNSCWSWITSSFATSIWWLFFSNFLSFWSCWSL